MFSANADALSSSELRERLHKRFKDKGVQETLKTQLRTELIRELKPPAFTGDPSSRPAPVKADSHLLSVCNCIVADYLHSSGYKYTFSVFRPESNLDTGKIFRKEDLLQVLEMSPQSSLYKSLLMNEKNDQGVLINLLTHATRCHTPHLYRNAATQTTGASGDRSLIERMETIERECADSREDDQVLLHSKLDAYKRQTEMQMQMQVDVKMQYFKDIELAKMRMEVQVTFQKEFDRLRQELEMTYETKVKKLNAKENNMMNRFKKQQQIEENDVFIKRQTLLKEREAVQRRGNELRRQMEALEGTCKIHDEKVKTTEELLRRRELLTKIIEDTHNHRLQNELFKYELEFREEYIQRSEKLTESEQRNVLETVDFQKELAAINAKVEEHSTILSEVRRLQDELNAAQQKTSVLNQQKEQLKEKLGSMSDYPRLKSEKAQLEEREQLLATQLEDLRQENQQLCADLEKPSKEHLALQMELQRLQSERRAEKETFNNERQFLQSQIWLEVKRCGQVKVQLTECEENLQWLTGHVENLKKRLDQNQEFKRRLQAIFKSSCLGSNLNDNQTLPRSTTCDAVQRDSCGSNTPNMALGTEPSAWIVQLQEEAEAFQDAYRKILVISWMPSVLRRHLGVFLFPKERGEVIQREREEMERLEKEEEVVGAVHEDYFERTREPGWP
ncbi:centriole and centriolar satellite protein ofd1-like [Dunckerocampus dactyliophorus]|uniref:centriole and centriolar satellite protein ofd1-like n=1 Tax=Dunckerocampus dactyliophorus TaxID=161453 RepID=UPI002406876E|nr:centriole and centriolar satellite protein ofd1-like [Dunckerocampus dactyliophorus]